MVTVQYANHWIENMSMEDLRNIPLRGARPDGYGPMQGGRQAMPVAAQVGAGGMTPGTFRLEPWLTSGQTQHANGSGSLTDPPRD